VIVVDIRRISDDQDPLYTEFLPFIGNIFEGADAGAKLHAVVRRFVESVVEDELIRLVPIFGKLSHARDGARPPGF
jgi:hypothetical protein